MVSLQNDTLIGKKFPTIPAKTLSGDQVVFPDQLNKKVNLVILAFEEWAQKDVDTWAAFLLKEYDIDDEINYYELPMMSKFYSWLSGWIDGGMKQGISPVLHDNVATFYGERKPYFDFFGIEDLNTCYVYLLDEEGKIQFAASGPMQKKKQEELILTINKLKE